MTAGGLRPHARIKPMTRAFTGLVSASPSWYMLTATQCSLFIGTVIWTRILKEKTVIEKKRKSGLKLNVLLV
jgi:hypothetical protein